VTAPVRRRVCVVGSGTHFLSGISYYTYHLTRALSEESDISVILMRRLIPRRLYPGRARVGLPITDLNTSDWAPTYDGIDWFVIPSLMRASRFMRQHRPEAVVLQWWTGTALFSYLRLASIAREIGAKVIIEFHEDIDTAEAALPVVGTMVRKGLARLVRQSSAFVVHSSWDRDRLSNSLGLDPAKVTVIPHGPYPLAGHPSVTTTRLKEGATTRTERTVLFFGTVRPYKGLEDLIEAFELLPRDETREWKLLVVGETWERWHLPASKIERSPHAADIEFVNRYVRDDEVPALFARADVVCLPYRRSSASGPLHVTMSRGLPVVVTRIGGLTEAAAGYSGAVFTDPGDPRDLAAAIIEASSLRPNGHRDPHSWERTARAFGDLIEVVSPRTTHPDRGVDGLGTSTSARKIPVST